MKGIPGEAVQVYDLCRLFCGLYCGSTVQTAELLQFADRGAHGVYRVRLQFAHMQGSIPGIRVMP